MKKVNWQKILHWLIITNFILGMIYGTYLVFFVVGGGGIPLFQRATRTPIEVILKRRLYSVEVWVATSGLSIYLALTEILPRKVSSILASEDTARRQDGGS